ncbi:hypothetical protein MVES1_000586 [Malassezia vespertilionis]|uniref:uncharacterized protein n=1 Tax=Malassezia vespertilionis TaxID=2020962 RepID=UPI0024B25A75|nr:uncharacterized protein MVES1_000586 [Malassezia vespertilionis]WFD05258.1 hypothetical protein MVES1_000586 [Malassezia vespertilionis]
MNIPLSSDALDVAFNPNPESHTLAVALVSGKIQLFDYSRLMLPDGAVRGAEEEETGKEKRNDLVATGDDDGVVRLWDPRLPSGEAKPLQSYDHHFDWITDMIWDPHLEAPRARGKEEQAKRKREDPKNDNRSRLVCTSGDGTLSVINVRSKKKAVEVSEDQEDELLSIAAIKGGKKLVVGTQLGILSLWAPSRGLLDHLDRFPGHPSSVDAICALDDDTVLTGSSDGLIRVVQLFPHKLLGIIADHGGMPVERMQRKGNLLASLGHSSECKLTNLGPLLDGDEEDEEAMEEPMVVNVSTSLPTISHNADASDNASEEDSNESIDSDQVPGKKVLPERTGDAVVDEAQTRAAFFADL